MSFPRLSPEGERVFKIATQRSAEFGHSYLGVEHLVLGLAEVEQKRLGTALASVGAQLEHYVDVLRGSMEESGDGVGAEGMIQLTPRCRKVLSMADVAATREDATLVGPGHILEAVFRENRSLAMRLIRVLEVDVVGLREALERTPQAPVSTPTPMLDRYGRDLTALARRGKLSPVIGREKEMDLVAQVLLRKNKNNPVLIGDSGVGKTAVVEGFAQRLLAPNCPAPLAGRRIMELSLGSLVAGTKFRGEFEERLTEITKEIAANPEVILFLDELHSLVGAGSTGTGDALDAANLLKPALARGELRCIGATTIEEYRRYIEPDAALERRFEKILIDEPTPQEALEILTRLRKPLEQHHELEILPAALSAAVDLTVKHVFDRRLPDKALDAVDQSCARRRLERYASDDGGAAVEVQVDAEDIARTVAQWTGIPLERMSGEAAVSLLNIEDELHQRVVGQERAVRAVARTILTAKAGLADPGRPLGVFFFKGPTGVGKTHLAKSLAEVLFGDSRRLVRIDMSEYAEAHSVSNLIGAPPGYVGHEREGTLISALRTHPHCIVLFDEIEKAHPRVFDLFLQIFDEGRLTGTHGRTADFTQSVVILTSNIDTGHTKARPLGFAETGTVPEADPRTELQEHLRPELVNRLDEIVEFETLSSEALRRIVDHYIGGIEERLAESELELDLTSDVYDHLLQLADCEVYGARELRRVVDRHLRQPLATEVLRVGQGVGRIRVSLDGDTLRFVTLAGSESVS